MEVKCSKLTDLFGAGVHTPAGAAAAGDERVEAYMLSLFLHGNETRGAPLLSDSGLKAFLNII